MRWRIPLDWAPDGVRLEVAWILNQDPRESGFPDFDRICAGAVEVYTDPPERRVPLLLTCGAIEENLANNQLMAPKRAAAAYPSTFATVPDAHTTIGWRDAWAPHLDRLVDGVT